VSVIVLDTDVASAVLRRRTPEPLSGLLAGQILAVTFVTVGELTKWTLVRRWGPRSLDSMRTFLASLVVLPYDSRVATRWGELQAYAQLRGRPRPTNDSWTAACCLVRDLPLGLHPATADPGRRLPRASTRSKPAPTTPAGYGRHQRLPSSPPSPG
jgi:predicted nucleic acid-binding protein